MTLLSIVGAGNPYVGFIIIILFYLIYKISRIKANEVKVGKLLKLSKRVVISFPPISRGVGLYLIPTIKCWISDFTGPELMGVMGFKSYGFCLHLFVWQIGFCINITPKKNK